MSKLAGLFLASSVLFLHPRANAQQITRHEVGLGLYAQSDTPYAGTSAAYKLYLGGPLARYTFNLNRSVALEASATDSWNMEPTDALLNRVGGHQLLVLGGLKAGVRRQHFGLYGKLEAGAASYTRGAVAADFNTDLTFQYFRETHFALQPGVAIEWYVSKRNILRLDIDESLNASFKKILFQSPFEEVYSPGSVPHHLGLALTAEHRFGSFQDASEFTPKTESVTVGAFFPLQIREHLLEQDAPVLGGGGAWIGTPIWRFLSADIIAFDIPHDDHTAGAQDGGTSFSAFAGPKLGFHLGRLGLFVKARPGITRFSRTDFGVNLVGSIFFVTNRPQVQFTLDTGGVIEYSPFRHAVLRFEAGDAFIHYHSHVVIDTISGREASTHTVGISSSVSAADYPPMHNSSILFLTGLGWRF
ncbi:MAG: hypothetical protein ABSA39_20845 [Edaphobacter sp.]